MKVVAFSENNKVGGSMRSSFDLICTQRSDNTFDPDTSLMNLVSNICMSWHNLRYE